MATKNPTKSFQGRSWESSLGLIPSLVAAHECPTCSWPHAHARADLPLKRGLWLWQVLIADIAWYCVMLQAWTLNACAENCGYTMVYRYTPLMVILRGTMMIKQRIFEGLSGTCICFPVTYMMKIWRANKKGGHREAENSVEAALWLWQPMESGHAQARLWEVGSLFGKGGCPVTDKRQKEKPVPKNSPEASTFWWHPSINS